MCSLFLIVDCLCCLCCVCVVVVVVVVVCLFYFGRAVLEGLALQASEDVVNLARGRVIATTCVYIYIYI